METLYLTRNLKIEPNEIMYLESESNYTLIYTTNKSKTITSQTLHVVHSSINYDNFLRISRKHIINIEHISTIYLEKNRLTFKLSNGEKFIASRRRTKDCLDRVKFISFT
ncbi:LytTr DNA-binding region [Emticicia oligotrophica DSM 17448]|uniref:LytTr DNA-binding region n=1 Tax=Emticicia oligotrophica (strain DSM 17448 / CIP 109782 / MTCC 6937 / GPTSA100-15) TaxID=929562 RepID=A0ABM5N530_EMTOG|nr:LytTR family DNA-binding domain-containing protein [Emticicia oligotrophica]AFK04558.1 LytTr DNA-binding region [Emticicia oligotrophica DSM 17448]